MQSNTISLTRREMAQCLMAVTGSALLADWASAQDDNTRLQITLPAAGGSEASSFEIFLALSRIVLIQADLDRAVARQMYDLFIAEPYGGKHIATAYAALRASFLALGQHGGADTVAQAKLPYGETWFISHLVTTWYVGVYYHPERPTHWITLGGAMMYRAARGLVPKPYEESVGFGNWARPPEPRK
jgi:hypothetical protein